MPPKKSKYKKSPKEAIAASQPKQPARARSQRLQEKSPPNEEPSTRNKRTKVQKPARATTNNDVEGDSDEDSGNEENESENDEVHFVLNETGKNPGTEKRPDIQALLELHQEIHDLKSAMREMQGKQNLPNSNSNSNSNLNLNSNSNLNLNLNSDSNSNFARQNFNSGNPASATFPTTGMTRYNEFATDSLARLGFKTNGAVPNRGTAQFGFLGQPTSYNYYAGEEAPQGDSRNSAQSTHPYNTMVSSTTMKKSILSFSKNYESDIVAACERFGSMPPAPFTVATRDFNKHLKSRIAFLPAYRDKITEVETMEGIMSNMEIASRVVFMQLQRQPNMETHDLLTVILDSICKMQHWYYGTCANIAASGSSNYLDNTTDLFPEEYAKKIQKFQRTPSFKGSNFQRRNDNSKNFSNKESRTYSKHMQLQAPRAGRTSEKPAGNSK